MAETHTIIYYSDSRLDPTIEKVCTRELICAADGKPIISVTQKPLELGRNICVGDIGSSWLSLYKQLQIGTTEAKTKYVAMAEADCLYTPEHYNFIPTNDDKFFYNENVWFVQWGGNHPELNGMYSTFWEERRALSQLICTREALLRSLDARLKLVGEHQEDVKKICAGEPGLSKIRLAQKLAKEGGGVSLAPYLKDFLETEQFDTFRTALPNLDIRHSTNFTGPKRGKNRRYELPYWGKFEDVINDTTRTADQS